MRAMISITITNKIENQQLTHLGGPLEIGRGSKRGGPPRIALQDGFVSRDHVKIEELSQNKLAVENLSQRSTVAVDQLTLLLPGQRCESPMPVRIGIGESVIEVDGIRPDDSGEHFLTVSAPMYDDATMVLPSLLSLGKAPNTEQIVGWLEPVVALLRAADEKELYRQTAQVLVERIGLDTGAVLLRNGNIWRTVAYTARDQNINQRTLSHALLRKVVTEKRTFYLPVAAVGATQSLMGVQSLVGSPIFDEKHNVIGAVTGSRSVKSLKNEIGALEAQVVQLLATAVGVGRGRFDRNAEASRLRVAVDAAEQANRTKSQFLAMVSHELRTPLTTIIGYSEMLLDQSQMDQLPQYGDDLSQIHTAAKHLLVLINDILDLSKIEAGKIDIARESYEQAEIIVGVVSSVEPQASTHHNTLQSDCPATLGPAVGDPIRFRQCVLNLMANACKFTSKGQVKLKADRVQNEGVDWLRVVVEDTGIGMTAEQMERLFQPFTQVDSSAGRKQGGTGLGLAISQKLAKAMGGRITVESEPDRGSRFTLMIRAILPKITEG